MRLSFGCPSLASLTRTHRSPPVARLRARVFAERTRLRNIAESQISGKTLSSLRAENARLKKKVATFEATQAKLQARIKKLLAEKRAGR